ncbi:6127_t:CDS:2 [Diversispora eburnea]|uniref:6127_t:CDS:1 n=1 Tax=Diversispora eburnea TaxID=1213867 RepID=A0A9N8WKH0_9GLOM|nr:6127_t:CDS:2 [Diversispora eburnea]
MATTMCLVSGSLILIDGLFYITFNKKKRTDESNLLSINSGFLGPFFTSKSTKSNKCNQKFSLSNDNNNTCQNCGQQSAIIIEKLKAALVKEVKTLGTPPVDHSVESLEYDRNFKLTSFNKNYKLELLDSKLSVGSLLETDQFNQEEMR